MSPEDSHQDTHNTTSFILPFIEPSKDKSFENSSAAIPSEIDIQTNYPSDSDDDYSSGETDFVPTNDSINDTEFELPLVLSQPQTKPKRLLFSNLSKSALKPEIIRSKILDQSTNSKASKGQVENDILTSDDESSSEDDIIPNLSTEEYMVSLLKLV